jgi:rhodanese-related sulfurtransferase
VTAIEIITREGLKEKMDRGDEFFLIEVLPERSYRHAHLPGAVNLPAGRVRELAPGLLPGKAADIVVYCGSFR